MKVIPWEWYKELPGTDKVSLKTESDGHCGFAVLGGACASMKLNEIESIEFNVHVSAECQKEKDPDHGGDWIAVWLEPVCWATDGSYKGGDKPGGSDEPCWNNKREVDFIESAGGANQGYFHTNFAGFIWKLKELGGKATTAKPSVHTSQC